MLSLVKGLLRDNDPIAINQNST